MDKTRSRFRKRLQASFLALAMLLSMLSGISFGTPGTTAHAAGSGTIKIMMLDSTVPNADNNAVGEKINSDQTMAALDVWADSMTWSDLATLGQGTARMERRNLILFDITNWPNASTISGNTYITWDTLRASGNGIVNKGRVDYTTALAKTGDPTSGMEIVIDAAENGLEDGHKYVIMENKSESNLYSNDYGYMPNTEQSSSYGKGWQLIFQWKDATNMELGISAQGKWSYNINNAEDSSLFLMGDSQQPMHNEVMRGGFKFHVQDVDLLQDGKTQGTDNVSNSYFAVFNINDMAMAPGTFDSANTGSGGPYPSGAAQTEREARSGKSHVDTGYGYVTVYRDAKSPGNLSDPGKKMFFPAYNVSEVLDAWHDYLADCADPKYAAETKNKPWGGDSALRVSGLYGVSGTPYEVKGDSNYGLFVMGKNTDGLNIVPCMVLKAENGIVDTGAYALPVGNYLVVQVKAGEGYYIDEDFAPIISIGPWETSGAGTAYPSIPGYINASGMELEASQMGMTGSNNHPVAYVSAQQKTSVDLSTGLNGFSMSVNGRGSAKALTYGSKDTYISGSYYNINPDGQLNKPGQASSNGEAVGERRKAPSGTSRFNAYNAIVRGGVQFYLADSDDVLSDAAQAQNPYIAIPQGDGDLAGATFRLYNKPSQNILNAWTIENTKANTGATQSVGLGSDAVQMTFDSSSYKEYKAEYDNASKQYVLRIPSDDIPFGVFRLTQVMTGEGYGNEAGSENWTAEDHVELTVRYIGVWQENHVTATYACGVSNADGSAIDSATKLSETLAKYRIPADTGSLYLPQKLVTGGMVITARNTAGDDDAKIKVQIYNISDYYTYVDKNGDGVETRFETKQKEYNSSVKGRVQTVDAARSILSSWDASCVAEFDTTIGNLEGDVANAGIKLPYGTYLMAVTDLETGLTIFGDLVSSGRIDKEGAEIHWDILVGDKSDIPEVSTVLADTLYDIDSIAVDKDRSITDYVSLGNLKNDTSYIVYGMLVDKATGNMLEGSNVAYAIARGYVSADTAPVTPDATARQLYETGRQFDDAAKRVGQTATAYSNWLINVQSYAQGRSDIPGFLDKVMSALRAYRSDLDDATAYRGIISILGRYGMGETGSSVLDGTAMVKLEYPHVSTNVLEGTTVVGYVYVCVGDKAEANALSATSPSTLVAAVSPYMKGMHATLDDEAETGYIPGLDITAKASYTEGKYVDPTETVTGTVSYSNVEPGNSYRITAILKDMAGNDILDADGNPLTVTRDFVAKDTKGYENMTFEGLDVDKYNGQRLTVYATLYRTIEQGGVVTPYALVSKGDADSMGWKASDPEPGKNQVDVKAPLVTTTLTDKNGNKDVNFDIQVNLVDKITYRDLIPGEKYKSVLTLVGKDGKELYDDEGKKLTAFIEFTASATEQTVQIPIQFTGTKLQGLEIVAFNDLYHVSGLESLVAYEHNLEAASQTITAGGEEYKIHFTTSVTDDMTNTQYTRAVADAMLTDSVHIRNLDPSTKYVLVTEIARASNGNLVNQFQAVNTSVTSDTDGTIKIDVPIKANLAVFGGQTLVVYQTLYDEKETKVIASHCDRTDMNQRFYVADIDTVLTGENGRSKKIAPDLVEHKETRNLTENGEPKVQTIKTYTWEATLADQIYYSNLIPGNTYMVTSTVVTQDGRGTVGTSNLTFTPRSSSGVFTVYLDLDLTDYMGKKLVAFETITDTYTNTVIMSHEDLTDEDQTVEIYSPEDDVEDEDIPDADSPDVTDSPNANNPSGNPGKDIQTGVAERYGLYFAIAAILALIAAAGGVVYYKKRKG